MFITSDAWFVKNGCNAYEYYVPAQRLASVNYALVVSRVDVEYAHSQIEVAVLFGMPGRILALHAAFFVLSAQNFLYIFNGMPRLKER